MTVSKSILNEIVMTFRVHKNIIFEKKATVSVMVECLKDNDQLFFTTHNTDILDLPLPKHSFLFMKKDANDPDHPITCVSASAFLKRNTDSVRKADENDLLSVAPSTDLIFEICDI